jgi:hypothetical protein
MEKSGQHGFTTSWIICTSWIYSDPGENTFLTIDYPVLCKNLIHRFFSKNILTFSMIVEERNMNMKYLFIT